MVRRPGAGLQKVVETPHSLTIVTAQHIATSAHLPRSWHDDGAEMYEKASGEVRTVVARLLGRYSRLPCGAINRLPLFIAGDFNTHLTTPHLGVIGPNTPLPATLADTTRRER